VTGRIFQTLPTQTDTIVAFIYRIMMLFVVTRALICFEFVFDLVLHECVQIYLVSFDFLAIKLFMFCICDLLLINT
jgi:hypothetical protein